MGAGCFVWFPAVLSFCRGFFTFVKRLCGNPSVSLRLPAPLSGELDETSPERGGGPAKLVEGSLWNLLLHVSDFTEAPLSQPVAASSPKGEPIIHKGVPDNKASPLGEGNRR